MQRTFPESPAGTGSGGGLAACFVFGNSLLWSIPCQRKKRPRQNRSAPVGARRLRGGSQRKMLRAHSIRHSAGWCGLNPLVLPPRYPNLQRRNRAAGKLSSCVRDYQGRDACVILPTILTGKAGTMRRARPGWRRRGNRKAAGNWRRARNSDRPSVRPGSGQPISAP